MKCKKCDRVMVLEKTETADYITGKLICPKCGAHTPEYDLFEVPHVFDENDEWRPE
jgi:DNA-directed RNA polymerase subunit M/transcription elongation factor TFIIS